VMAYHFFRLLQRAKEVVLIHVLPSDTYGAGEKSRFILQIEHELAKMNPNITLTYPTIKFIEGKENQQEETKLEIQKTEDILQFIENEITEKGIYPSHMNQYLDCSLKYYFSRIAGIAEEDVVEEKMGVDTFGNWIHKTFENIDKEFVENSGVVEKEDLEKVLENIDSYLKQAFKETNMGLRAEEGMNYILYQVGETIVKKFLTYQLKNEIFPLELLDVEKTLKVQFMVNVNNKLLPVKFAGRIDRMDRTGGSHVRVIDYKTGKVEAKDLKINAEDLAETLLTDKDKDKFRQLWLYKYMVLKQMVSSKGLTIRGIKLDETENTVSSGIYSFRNIDEGLLQQNISFHEGETINDFLYESEQYLQAFVQDLLNPEKPFEKRKDVENCVYCDYRRICGR
jgi:PD-(D/E)XK nuclease superfamily